jgi:hypothetical protein
MKNFLTTAVITYTIKLNFLHGVARLTFAFDSYIAVCYSMAYLVIRTEQTTITETLEHRVQLL